MCWNNAAETMFGYGAEEIIGQPITRIIPTNLIDEEYRIFDLIRSGQKIAYLETKRLQKDGTIVPVSISVSPIHNDQGQLVGVAQFTRDCPERDEREWHLLNAHAELPKWNPRKATGHALRAAKEVTEQANRAKSHFLERMSHELLTPLNEDNDD